MNDPFYLIPGAMNLIIILGIIYFVVNTVNKINKKLNRILKILEEHNSEE